MSASLTYWSMERKGQGSRPLARPAISPGLGGTAGPLLGSRSGATQDRPPLPSPLARVGADSLHPPMIPLRVGHSLACFRHAAESLSSPREPQEGEGRGGEGQQLPLVPPEANVMKKASQAVSSLGSIRPLGLLCNWSRVSKTADHRCSDR